MSRHSKQQATLLSFFCYAQRLFFAVLFGVNCVKNEKAVLNSGFVQTLPAYDQAGRQIIVCNMSEFLKVGNFMNMVRFESVVRFEKLMLWLARSVVFECYRYVLTYCVM